MARSQTDLPRMQNQARSRAPVERGLKVAAQAAGRGREAEEPPAADDAAVRAGRAGPALQSRTPTRPAQPRLCLRHEGAWRAEARLRRSLFLPSARSRGDPDRPQARRRDDRGGAAARHDRGHRRDARRDRPDVRPGHRRSWSRASPSSRSSTSSRARPSRPRTCASSCSPSPTTCACCWSSSPTGCTTCARSSTCRRKARRRIAEETLDIYAPLAGRMGMQEHARGAGGPGVPRSSIRKPTQRRQRAARRARASATSASDRRDRAAAHRASSPSAASTADGQGPAEAALFDLAQDGAQGGRLRAALRHLRLPRHRRRPCASATARSASCTRPGRWCRAASRTTSRRRSRTTIARSTPP